MQRSKTNPSSQHGAVAIATAALVCVLSGCSGHGNSDSTATAASAGSATMTDAEIKYGVSPTRNKDVTYQDDVIVMEHGAEAIRSLSSNGLTYTIDANAPGAKDIQPDKILFATGRVVGRVLEVKRSGSDLAVTLGPIELTDVFKEAHFSYHGTLDPDKVIMYIAPPDYPGTFIDRDTAVAPGAMRGSPGTPIQIAQLSPSGPQGWGNGGCNAAIEVARRFTPAGGSGCGGGGVVGQIVDMVKNGIHFTPNPGQVLGVTATTSKNGMTFTAYAKMQLNRPDFTFNLDIHGGKLNTAEVEVALNGKFKIGVAGRTNGEFHNPSQVTEIPADASIALPLPAPISVTFHNAMLIQTLFTAKQASLVADGVYSLSGTVKAGIVNGRKMGSSNLALTVDQGLAESLGGYSIGVNGVVLGYSGKILAGIGAYSLAVGPYASLSATIGVNRGSDAQGPITGYVCRESEFHMWLDYGVGVAIPGWTVKALNGAITVINTVTGIFSKKTRINATISPSYGAPLGTVKIKDIQLLAIPPGCGTKPAS